MSPLFLFAFLQLCALLPQPSARHISEEFIADMVVPLNNTKRIQRRHTDSSELEGSGDITTWEIPPINSELSKIMDRLVVADDVEEPAKSREYLEVDRNHDVSDIETMHDEGSGASEESEGPKTAAVVSSLDDDYPYIPQEEGTIHLFKELGIEPTPANKDDQNQHGNALSVLASNEDLRMKSEEFAITSTYGEEGSGNLPIVLQVDSSEKHEIEDAIEDVIVEKLNSAEDKSEESEEVKVLENTTEAVDGKGSEEEETVGETEDDAATEISDVFATENTASVESLPEKEMSEEHEEEHEEENEDEEEIEGGSRSGKLLAQIEVTTEESSTTPFSDEDETITDESSPPPTDISDENTSVDAVTDTTATTEKDYDEDEDVTETSEVPMILGSSSTEVSSTETPPTETSSTEASSIDYVPHFDEVSTTEETLSTEGTIEEVPSSTVETIATESVPEIVSTSDDFTTEEPLQSSTESSSEIIVGVISKEDVNFEAVEAKDVSESGSTHQEMTVASKSMPELNIAGQDNKQLAVYVLVGFAGICLVSLLAFLLMKRKTTRRNVDLESSQEKDTEKSLLSNGKYKEDSDDNNVKNNEIAPLVIKQNSQINKFEKNPNFSSPKNLNTTANEKNVEKDNVLKSTQTITNEDDEDTKKSGTDLEQLKSVDDENKSLLDGNVVPPTEKHIVRTLMDQDSIPRKAIIVTRNGNGYHPVSQDPV